MGRVKDEPRGRLAALQEILATGGKVLADQAQILSAGVQRRIVEVGRGVEGQLVTLVDTVEERFSQRADGLLSRLAISLRRDVDRVRERVRALEKGLGDLPRDGLGALASSLQAMVGGAAERTSAALARVEELGLRLQQLERRIAEISRESARDTLDARDIGQRLQSSETRLTDLGREVGTKLGELGALRERMTRIEGRVVDYSKEQIARTGELTGLRDRLMRLEGRLSDLSKEQVGRAVESAGLRERLSRLEQRAVPAAESPVPPAVPFGEPEHAPVPPED
jgi:chromosome segregation ATPase